MEQAAHKVFAEAQRNASLTDRGAGNQLKDGSQSGIPIGLRHGSAFIVLSAPITNCRIQLDTSGGQRHVREAVGVQVQIEEGTVKIHRQYLVVNIRAHLFADLQIHFQITEGKRREVQIAKVSAQGHAIGTVQRIIQTDIHKDIAYHIAEGIAKGKERTARVEDAAVGLGRARFARRIDRNIGSQSGISRGQIVKHVTVITLLNGHLFARTYHVRTHIITSVQLGEQVLLTDLESKIAKVEIHVDTLIGVILQSKGSAHVNGIGLAKARRKVHIGRVEVHAQEFLKDLHHVAVEGNDEFIQFEGDISKHAHGKRKRAAFPVLICVIGSDFQGEGYHTAFGYEVSGVIVVAFQHKVFYLFGTCHGNESVAIALVAVCPAHIAEGEVFFHVLLGYLDHRLGGIVHEDGFLHVVTFERHQERGTIGLDIVIHSADCDKLGNIQGISHVVSLNVSIGIRRADKFFQRHVDEGAHVYLHGRRTLQNTKVHVSKSVFHVQGKEGLGSSGNRKIHDLHESVGSIQESVQIKGLVGKQAHDIYCTERHVARDLVAQLDRPGFKAEVKRHLLA